MSSWRALFWHELTHGRAAGCNGVTGGAAGPGHQGRGPGRSRRGPPWFCDSPVPPLRQVDRTTGRPTGPAWRTARGMMGMEQRT